MTNENLIYWFNIGQKGLSNVMWQCAIINGNFDVDSIKVEDWRFDENNNPQPIWVSASEFEFHPRVAKAFEDLDRVARLVKESIEWKADVFVEGKNWLHIYGVFDLNDRNEYGVPKQLWG